MITRCRECPGLQAVNLLEQCLRRHRTTQEILNQGASVTLRAVAQQLFGEPAIPAGISRIESTQGFGDVLPHLGGKDGPQAVVHHVTRKVRQLLWSRCLFAYFSTLITVKTRVAASDFETYGRKAKCWVGVSILGVDEAGNFEELWNLEIQRVHLLRTGVMHKEHISFRSHAEPGDPRIYDATEVLQAYDLLDFAVCKTHAKDGRLRAKAVVEIHGTSAQQSGAAEYLVSSAL